MSDQNRPLALSDALWVHIQQRSNAIIKNGDRLINLQNGFADNI